jgi:Short C-terminal domain
MTNGFAKGLIVAGLAATVVIGLGTRPGLAHNDWGLPLVGGLAGGYALSSLMHERERPRETVVSEPVYAAPAPAYVAPAAPATPTASSIEHQLNVLDDLAAKGYITQEEYQTRREALLNQL